MKAQKVEAEQVPLDIPLDFSGEAGAGFEAGKHSTSDFKIPFLTILQSLSPQCVEGNVKYQENAKPGMVVNTVTGELYEARKSKNSSIVVVPLDRVTEYPEWKPGRGGLVTVHRDPSILARTHKGQGKEANADLLENGNVIDTTSKWFVMLLTKDGYSPAVIAMTRTNLKHSRSWLTKISSERGRKADGTVYQMPMFARHWKLSTVPEVKENNTFYTWDMEAGEMVKKQEAYLELKNTREAVVAGQLALPDVSSDHEADKPY